ncbi:hypothetical protein ACGH7X_05620 [Streptomyces sp. BBFR51]|uniref:hypothetical protein n=1 Tax=Streptomyces sp. BBFR51 TaxID=3372856 RepID=UPI0037DD1C35
MHRLTLPIHITEYDEDRWVTDHKEWCIAVRCDDPARAIAAPNAAGPRLLHVADDGSVQPGGAAGLTGPPGPSYTPNYVSTAEDDPVVWLDC